MTRRRLDWLLRAHGPALAEWPSRDRDAAYALLRRSAAARTLLADALAAEAPPEPQPELLGRMQARLRRALVPPPPVVRGMGWGALAACAAAGLYLGVGVAEPDAAPDLFTSAQTVTIAALEP